MLAGFGFTLVAEGFRFETVDFLRILVKPDAMARRKRRLTIRFTCSGVSGDPGRML